MLKHSCRDIAAAAILNAHRAQGASSSDNQLTAVTSASVLACAAHMATICSSRQAMLADYPTSSLDR